MKRTATISFLAAIALGSAIAARAQAQPDPFIGTWKLNLAKSHYDPAGLTPKTATILKREASGSGYKVIAEGVNATQGSFQLEYTVATLDGRDYPATGFADYDSASYRRIDANTMIYVNKRNGNVVRMSRMTVSKDGKINTVHQVGYTAQGVAFDQMVVYDRQ